ncbi:MAG: hypothetical protein CXR30_07840 [Geobacter sp.]|nr:MAG: hypothetical protein CXR30_07840 [Geobacter sp.]
MCHIMTIVVLLLATAGAALADGRVATFYADCAVVEIEAQAVKGVAEISLPAGMADDSLRIKPVGNSVIQRVDVLSPRQSEKSAHELETQMELRNRLEDRLRALDTREEIFRAAAKSQSAKAPRKTKTNPDPMQSIRQGTEFAITQLEAVYTARRKTEQEVRRCDARIAALKKQGQVGVRLARVAVTPSKGKVMVRYVLAGQGWTPAYDLRLNNDGNGHLTLYGRLPHAFAGYRLQAAPGTLADSRPERIAQVAKGAAARLAEFRLPVREERFEDGLRSSFSLVMQNSGDVHLPSGEAVLYRNGEYWGRFRFEGISSGRSRKIVSGS